jgi:hypothetical protein
VSDDSPDWTLLELVAVGEPCAPPLGPPWSCASWALLLPEADELDEAEDEPAAEPDAPVAEAEELVAEALEVTGGMAELTAEMVIKNVLSK